MLSKHGCTTLTRSWFHGDGGYNLFYLESYIDVVSPKHRLFFITFHKGADFERKKAVLRYGG